MSRDSVVAASAVGELMRREVLQDKNQEVHFEHAAEEVTAKSKDIAQGKKEYIIDRLVDH